MNRVPLLACPAVLFLPSQWCCETTTAGLGEEAVEVAAVRLRNE